MAAACAGMMLFSGCSAEKQKMFDQAEKDLSQGSYEYALEEYAACVENGVKLPFSYRGAGIANLKMGNYDAAAENFTNALNCEKVGKQLRKDLLSYRAATEYLRGSYENAMADCQTIFQDFSMDADSYFLTGKVALAMDSYDEASMNFEQAYGEDSTYARAIQIYEVYLDKDMEADGTRYLEAALTKDAKDAKDRCDRGRVYYYMEDYASAQQELIEASNKGNTEALMVLGMVYMAQKDVSNARAMYQEYVTKAERPAAGYNGLALCDMAEENYDSALSNIASGISTANGDEMQNLLFNEFVVYEKKLDFATARTKVEEYLTMYPDDAAAKKELAFLKTRK